MLEILSNFRLWDAIDILIVAFIIYRIILLIKGTRAVQMLIGIVVVLGLYIISLRVGFFTLHWILNNFIASMVLVIIVIFQDDIRRALTRVGRNPFISSSSDKLEKVEITEEVVRACMALAEKGTGALIVFERKTGLNNYIEKGILIDGCIQTETIVSVFQPTSPLHDGAIIIQEGRIAAAGCLLPLDTNIEISSTFGTRHRCALSLSKEADAVIVIVSEERGTISLAFEGTMRLNLSEQVLRDTLLKLFPPHKKLMKSG
ncbi:MAG: diadenylate cyclase CdaA [Deltaproteobacteria bacterium]|nr:diadenylate cyclase CdaA [Deltaproteobacteria bacterium]